MCLFCDSVCEVCAHQYKCHYCGKVCDTPLEMTDGHRCCNWCNNNKFDYCVQCNKLVFTDGIKGEWACADCCDCDLCDSHKPVLRVDGYDVCLECLDDNFRVCDECGEWTHDDCIICDDELTLCESCANTEYVRCVECGNLVRASESTFYRGNNYCSECYDNQYGTGEPVTSLTFNRIHTTRWYGVEIETCSACDDYADEGWGQEDEHCGMEFVSPLLQGDRGLDYIEELYCDVHPEVDDDCGLHVHIDIRDLSDSQRLELIRAFKANKDTFYDMVDSKRHNNRFCKQDIPEVEINDTWSSYMGRVSRARYCWINLNAFRKHGSIEIRLHEATSDPFVVIDWVIYLMRFVENATKELVGSN